MCKFYIKIFEFFAFYVIKIFSQTKKFKTTFCNNALITTKDDTTLLCLHRPHLVVPSGFTLLFFCCHAYSCKSFFHCHFPVSSLSVFATIISTCFSVQLRIVKLRGFSFIILIFVKNILC